MVFINCSCNTLILFINILVLFSLLLINVLITYKFLIVLNSFIIPLSYYCFLNIIYYFFVLLICLNFLFLYNLFILRYFALHLHISPRILGPTVVKIVDEIVRQGKSG